MTMPPNSQQPPLQQTFERLSTLLRAEEWRLGADHHLQPIQLQMLRYLSICNRYSNTPAAVTDYFGLTKGTVSQSLKQLETKGLLSKVRDAHDARSVHLLVTAAGSAVLTALAQASPLQQACERLDGATHQAINLALLGLLRAVQQIGKGKSFGVCSSCQYHQPEGEGRFRCGLTGEPLVFEETLQICREHTEDLTLSHKEHQELPGKL